MKERFLRQYSVDNYVIDFYCPKLKLAVEIDGDVHKEKIQKEYDLERQSYLESFGITFVRIENEELLGNPNMAFEKIEREIKRTPPKPSPLAKGRVFKTPSLLQREGRGGFRRREQHALHNFIRYFRQQTSSQNIRFSGRTWRESSRICL